MTTTDLARSMRHRRLELATQREGWPDTLSKRRADSFAFTRELVKDAEAIACYIEAAGGKPQHFLDTFWGKKL